MQSHNVWYLGIDLGTTGISAVLLNAKTRELHPIYWATLNQGGSTEYSARNPTAAHSGAVPKSDLGQVAAPSIAVGFLASALARNQSGLFIPKFKPFLKIGIPYYSHRTNDWEPVLQWSGEQTVSLYWLRRALQALLATLKPNLDPATSVKVAAADLDTEAFQAALLALSGVIMGGSTVDTYRFNIREAILGAGLVQYPEQIFFIEDAIATVLAELSSVEFWMSSENPELSKTPKPKLSGSGTLAIDAGATTTELAIVDLPEDLQNLSRNDFMLHSFPYGGSSLDQDIICQILFRQSESDRQDGEASVSLLARLCLIDSDFELPLPGEPDVEARSRLQQKLQSTPLGLALLEAAQKIKQILQHQDEFILNLGKQKCVCKASDLKNRVILPFIQRLNQEVNALLSQTNLSGQGIHQVICSGGTSSLDQMQKWLQQKFPDATFIKDEVRSIQSKQNSLHTFNLTAHTSKVAFGLAMLPFYPQVLERQEQQYSDYFLLLELCRAFPENSLTIAEIMQLLETRGINTRACYQRLIAILEGQLPANLVPSAPDTLWLTEASRQNLDYQTVVAAPLFEREGHQCYRLNSQQCQRLWRYLDSVLSGTYQKLEEPLIMEIAPFPPVASLSSSPPV